MATKNFQIYVVTHQLHLHEERGKGKKLIFAIRTMMFEEHVDMVACDKNGAAWRPFAVGTIERFLSTRTTRTSSPSDLICFYPFLKSTSVLLSSFRHSHCLHDHLNTVCFPPSQKNVPTCASAHPSNYGHGCLLHVPWTVRVASTLPDSPTESTPTQMHGKFDPCVREDLGQDV